MANNDIQDAVIRHARADMANIPAASHDPVEPKEATRKIGEGHLMGMIRLGGHELTQALAAFPDSNIRPQEEMGVFGNTTPQIATQEMGLSYADLLEKAADRGGNGNDRDRTR